MHQFAVPPRLSTLTFQLEAKVEQVSTGKKISLAAASTRQVNAIDKSEPTFDLHLSRIEGHAVLEVLGKTGERLADRAVRITIEHRDFKDSHSVSLKSDAGGRIDLGELPDIARITASSPGTNDTRLAHRRRRRRPQPPCRSAGRPRARRSTYPTSAASRSRAPTTRCSTNAAARSRKTTSATWPSRVGSSPSRAWSRATTA